MITAAKPARLRHDDLRRLPPRQQAAAAICRSATTLVLGASHSRDGAWDQKVAYFQGKSHFYYGAWHPDVSQNDASCLGRKSHTFGTGRTLPQRPTGGIVPPEGGGFSPSQGGGFAADTSEGDTSV